MKTRHLGKVAVGAVGLGCMGMSEFYGATDRNESFRVLERALELGVTLLDTADMYGSGENEKLLGSFFKEHPGSRGRVVLATKFGVRRNAGRYERAVDNSPRYVREACEASLARLGVECIDLYYMHLRDPAQPIEETVEAMAGLVREGKVRAIGLSEISAATLEKACAVHPVSAVQSEYSLWTREAETNGVLETCARLGAGFVAYSPLGRGFLTGAVRGKEGLAADDFRRILPRFEGDLLKSGLERVRVVESVAARKGCTPAQVALAWVLSRPWGIVPIPGTKRVRYLEQNVGATNVVLEENDLRELDAAFPADADNGPRYTAEGMKGIGL